MNKQLAKLICQHIEAVNELTEAIKNDKPTQIGNKIQALPRKLTFGNDGKAELEKNEFRQGFIATNETNDFVYGVANQNEATESFYTWRLESGGTEFYIPSNGAYEGPINWKALRSGYLMLTEFSFKEI